MHADGLNRIAVIGAGIVGLCTAHYLRKAGHAVVVIDPQDAGAGCSSGNAGSLASGAVAPLAMPGILRSAPGMLMDRRGPLYVPADYLLRVAPWMTRFVLAARPDRVARIAEALHQLIGDAVACHRALAAEIGHPELIVDSGQIHLYPNAEAMDKDAAGWALKREHGLRLERIDAARIHAMEPAVGAEYRVGYYLPEQPWVANPQRYATALADLLKARGVEFVRTSIRRLQAQETGWRLHGDGASYAARQVVLAAGAWSAELLATLNLKVPLESQRGYHLKLLRPGVSLSRIVVLADRKVFITPMEDGLRVAGTVEFGGLQRLPSERRAALLAEHAEAGLPGLDTRERESWMGHRPCLPDSLPVIGPVPGHGGLWCAFGHGHLGLTGSAPTGRLIAAAIGDPAQARRLAPFSLSRFHGAASRPSTHAR
ncbi:FAD-dependent oxidoreductase [Pseudomonas sp. PS02288]|uniref:NAD(P)/FAD-dependent oxidoreductase n=1 Tax=Pseudomonas sp. PS02288 TaxID=2991443 RepID=UPI00249A596D|nr:FAD-dependent oxidoreductase [Pseudomonas sp. PS02288]